MRRCFEWYEKEVKKNPEASEERRRREMTRVSCVMALALLTVQLAPQWNEVELFKRVGNDVLTTNDIT
jgi:hypothetical protein